VEGLRFIETGGPPFWVVFLLCVFGVTLIFYRRRSKRCTPSKKHSTLMTGLPEILLLHTCINRIASPCYASSPMKPTLNRAIRQYSSLSNQRQGVPKNKDDEKNYNSKVDLCWAPLRGYCWCHPLLECAIVELK